MSKYRGWATHNETNPPWHIQEIQVWYIEIFTEVIYDGKV